MCKDFVSMKSDSLKSHIWLLLCGIAEKFGFSKLATRTPKVSCLIKYDTFGVTDCMCKEVASNLDSLSLTHIRLSLCGIAAKVGFSKLATRAAI